MRPCQLQSRLLRTNRDGFRVLRKYIFTQPGLGVVKLHFAHLSRPNKLVSSCAMCSIVFSSSILLRQRRRLLWFFESRDVGHHVFDGLIVSHGVRYQAHLKPIKIVAWRPRIPSRKFLI